MTVYSHDPARLDYGSWHITGPARVESGRSVVDVECKGCGLKTVRILSKLRNGYTLRCKACAIEERRIHGHLPAPHRTVT